MTSGLTNSAAKRAAERSARLVRSVVDACAKPVVRLDASPHGLALGLAFGIFMATTPFLGLQVCGAAGLAWLFGANIPAAVIGTFWANPVTYPLLLLASYRLGAALLNVQDTFNPTRFTDGVNAIAKAVFVPGRSAVTIAYELLLPVAMPLTLGAMLIGLLSAVVFYVVARRAIVFLRFDSAAAPEAPTTPSGSSR
jgi:uncharacterized protein